MQQNNIKQDLNIKGTNLMGKEMDMASSIIKMVDIIKEIGKIIKWMDLENCIIKEENQHIKDTGKKISFMDLEKYLMIILLSQIVDLISLILIIQKIIGNIMKDFQLKIPNKVEEKLNLQMEKYSKEIFIMIEYKDMENSLLQMVAIFKAYGEILNLSKLLALELLTYIKMIYIFVIIFFYSYNLSIY